MIELMVSVKAEASYRLGWLGKGRNNPALILRKVGKKVQFIGGLHQIYSYLMMAGGSCPFHYTVTPEVTIQVNV